eukprot:1560221-Pleurochrysis_carterae.AAC.1
MHDCFVLACMVFLFSTCAECALAEGSCSAPLAPDHRARIADTAWTAPPTGATAQARPGPSARASSQTATTCIRNIASLSGPIPDGPFSCIPVKVQIRRNTLAQACV